MLCGDVDFGPDLVFLLVQLSDLSRQIVQVFLLPHPDGRADLQFEIIYFLVLWCITTCRSSSEAQSCTRDEPEDVPVGYAIVKFLCSVQKILSFSEQLSGENMKLKQDPDDISSDLFRQEG